ncbi:MAG: hypothetical protein AAF701_00775 [Pseudomonadota bacterium]
MTHALADGNGPRHDGAMIADLYAGDFASQPLVFAHLWDLGGDTYNPDGIEVICNQDPSLRLRHYFSEDNARHIEDAMGLHTTCVIVFHTAQLDLGTSGSDHLIYLGSHTTLRLAPG